MSNWTDNSTNITTTSHPGGINPFLPHDQFLSQSGYFTYLSVVCVMTVIPTSLCLLILCAACRSRKLRTVTNIFVFNLAAISLLSGSVELSFSLSFVSFTAAVHSPTLSFCKAVLFFDLYALATSMWASVAIGLDRCDVLTRPLSRRIDHRWAYIISAFTWFLPLVFCIPGVTGWGEIVYQSEGIADQGQCYVDPVRSYNFIVFWAVFALLAPTIVIIVCYCVIIYVIRNKALTRRALMYVEPIPAGQASNNLQFNKTEAQAFRISFLIILTNIILMSPFVVLLLLKLDVASRSVGVAHVITIILLDTNIAINSILFTLGVRSVRNEVTAMCQCCRTKGSHSIASLSPVQYTKSTALGKPYSEDTKAHGNT